MKFKNREEQQRLNVIVVGLDVFADFWILFLNGGENHHDGPVYMLALRAQFGLILLNFHHSLADRDIASLWHQWLHVCSAGLSLSCFESGNLPCKRNAIWQLATCFQPKWGRQQPNQKLKIKYFLNNQMETILCMTIIVVLCLNICQGSAVAFGPDKHQIEDLLRWDALIESYRLAGWNDSKIKSAAQRMLRIVRANVGEDVKWEVPLESIDDKSLLSKLLSASFDDETRIVRRLGSPRCCATEQFLLDLISRGGKVEIALPLAQATSEKDVIMRALQEKRQSASAILKTNAQRVWEHYNRVYRKFKFLRIRVYDGLQRNVVGEFEITLLSTQRDLVLTAGLSDNLDGAFTSFSHRNLKLSAGKGKRLFALRNSKFEELVDFDKPLVSCGLVPPAVSLFYM